MKVYGGIDLHSDNSVVGLIDEKDKVLYLRRLPNDLDVILKELSRFRNRLKVWWWNRPTTGTG